MSKSVGTERSRRRPVAGLLALPVVLVVLASACVTNGSWAAVAPAVIPVQGEPTAFTDVSCVSEDWCMGVGAFGGYPMVQVWDGSDWSVAQAPPLATATLAADMKSVDCGSPTSCVAWINRYPDDPSYIYYLVAWDGATWREVPPGSPVEYPADDPAPYSCAPDGGCLIFLARDRLTVEWDGAQFTTTPATTSSPGSSDVQAIECFAGDDCIALTPYDLQHWDGTAWSQVPDSGLQGLGVWPMTEFACGSSSSCVAYAVGNDSSSRGLHWDGTTWASAPLPASTMYWEGDLSCAGPDECVGFTDDQGTQTAIAWNGDGWHLAPAAPNGAERLSCLPLRCLAVGHDGSPATPGAWTYTWTNP